jgi:LytS/YehU family sensor histidine kinase
MELQAREAELRALRSQVHPHFLFNSLNSIHALIAADPGGARTMLLRLADLLRRTLSVGAATLIPLREELAIVEDYLRIEKVRFGDRLRVETDVPPTVSEWPVPPFCLQPLVENAVVHGISRLVEGGTIRISAESGRDSLMLTVRNPSDGVAAQSHGTGTGLRNLRLRLETLYGRSAGLTGTPAPEEFRVQMNIPLRRPA